MVAQFLARQLSIREIVDALDKARERNPQTGEPWSRQAVHSDVLYLKRQWREHYMDQVAMHAARVLANLQQIQREAWARGRIDIALKAIQQECRILGLEEPIKVDITARLIAAAEAAGLDPNEVIVEAQRILDETRDA